MQMARNKIKFKVEKGAFVHGWNRCTLPKKKRNLLCETYDFVCFVSSEETKFIINLWIKYFFYLELDLEWLCAGLTKVTSCRPSVKSVLNKYSKNLRPNNYAHFINFYVSTFTLTCLETEVVLSINKLGH